MYDPVSSSSEIIILHCGFILSIQGVPKVFHSAAFVIAWISNFYELSQCKKKLWKFLVGILESLLGAPSLAAVTQKLQIRNVPYGKRMFDFLSFSRVCYYSILDRNLTRTPILKTIFKIAMLNFTCAT
jgi:hypothetical protein